MKRFLKKLSLDRPELRAWASYDWANSPYLTIVITAVFPIYYRKTLAADLSPNQATVSFSIATAIAGLLIALSGPVLGVIADRMPIKKALLAAFMSLGVASTFALYFVPRGGWEAGLTLFVIGNLGLFGGFVFYDSLLPSVARPEEMDRVSSAGYAFGYVGGGLLLAFDIFLIEKWELFGFADKGMATRVAFITTGVWWVLFSIPLFRRVPEPPIDPAVRLPAGVPPWSGAFSGAVRSFRDLARHRQALLFVVAFVIYNDGISTIIRMSTAYGAEIGLVDGDMIKAILLVQFVGIPCTFLFGLLAGRIGTKPTIVITLAVYSLVSILAYRMKTSGDFLFLALLVGLVQGGAQALSRSLFASMIPKARSAEYFGIFAIFEKVGGFLGPGIFAVVAWATGSSQGAILSTIAFFIGGSLLLLRVDVDKGRAEAEAPASHPLAKEG